MSITYRAKNFGPTSKQINLITNSRIQDQQRIESNDPIMARRNAAISRDGAKIETWQALLAAGLVIAAGGIVFYELNHGHGKQTPSTPSNTTNTTPASGVGKIVPIPPKYNCTAEAYGNKDTSTINDTNCTSSVVGYGSGFSSGYTPERESSPTPTAVPTTEVTVTTVPTTVVTTEPTPPPVPEFSSIAQPLALLSAVAVAALVLKRKE